MTTPATLVAIPVDITNPNTSWVLYARVIGIDNIPITTAMVSEITYVIHEPGSATAFDSGEIDKEDVTFDRLQTKADDSRWTGTGAGFNFRWLVVAEATPSAGQTYRYRIKIQCTDGSIQFFARDRSAIDWGGPDA